jgi:chorismate mutase
MSRSHDRPSGPSRAAGDGTRAAGGGARADADAEIGRLRDRIDELDRRIVALLNERATLGLGVGRAKADAGRRAVRDAHREREVLLRVAMANDGPLGQAELLSVYRRIVAATRELESRDRATRDGGGGLPGGDLPGGDLPDGDLPGGDLSGGGTDGGRPAPG